MTKSTLSRLIRALRTNEPENTPAKSEEVVMTDSKNQDDVVDGLTLQDRELIGIIETMDRRIASLEHDMWLVRSKIDQLTSSGEQAQ